MMSRPRKADKKSRRKAGRYDEAALTAKRARRPMTRAEQIREALELLAPPAHERDACRRAIEEAIDLVEKMAVATDGRPLPGMPVPANAPRLQHTKEARQAWRAYFQALRQLEARCNALKRFGWKPPIELDKEKVERTIAWTEHWFTHWKPPAPTLKQRTAVALARELSGDNTVSRQSQWFKLAQILYGCRVDLFRQVRTFEFEWRRFSKDVEYALPETKR